MSEKDNKSDWIWMNGHKSRVMNDYIVMHIMSYVTLKDLFGWQKMSRQFWECSLREFVYRKHLSVDISGVKNKEFLCPTDKCRKLCLMSSNDIQKAIHYQNSVYYLNQSLTNFITIAANCQRIESMALKNCYLDIQVIAAFDQNFNQLKCLSLIQCRINQWQIFQIKTFESFSKNVIHLSVDQLYGDNEKEEINDQQMSSFLLSFENLVQLTINGERNVILNQVLNQLPQTLVSIYIKAMEPTLEEPEFVSMQRLYNNLNNYRLQCLDIHNYFITEDVLIAFNINLNLKKFSFSCLEIQWQTITDIAIRQTELTHLGIIWSVIQDYQHIENVKPFRKLRYFEIHHTAFDCYLFREMINLVPEVKTFYTGVTYRHIECGHTGDLVQNHCKTCIDMCFFSITRLKKLSTFYVSFEDISPAFISSLHGFPHLKRLEMSRIIRDATLEYVDNAKETTKYNSYLKDIIITLIDICSQNPKKPFRLGLRYAELLILPQNIVSLIPKNLIITKD